MSAKEGCIPSRVSQSLLTLPIPLFSSAPLSSLPLHPPFPLPHSFSLAMQIRVPYMKWDYNEIDLITTQVRAIS